MLASFEDLSTLSRDNMVNQPQSRHTSEDIKLETIRWHQRLQEITYLEAGQHMRALNQLMWQIPSFVIAVNGGLWYATTIASESSLRIIFVILFLFDVTTILSLVRLRQLIGVKIKKQQEIENPDNHPLLKKLSCEFNLKFNVPVVAKGRKYIVVGCWIVMLIICAATNLAGSVNPKFFSKTTHVTNYSATIKSNGSGLIIEAKQGGLK